MITNRVSNQLYVVRDFFTPTRFESIKQQYRCQRTPFEMQYDNRLLTPWSNTPELQQIVIDELPVIQDIVGKPLAPQVAYVSIDLPSSGIMMHRLHPDIYVQVQICMGETTDPRMDFAFCNDAKINANSEIDYQPLRPITRRDTDIVEYSPNTASVYLNEPRSFVGMLRQVPNNTIREVLVLSYTRLY